MGKPLQHPVSVIIPAFNERAAVRQQAREIQAILEKQAIEHEIIVVDDGSQDNTAEEALQAGVRVLRHTENRGYGAAIKTGILAARHDINLIIDADGTYPADQIPELLVKLVDADMVVGARIGEHVSIPWLRRPAKWLLRWLASLIAGQSIPDLNSGLRVFRRECVQQYFPILSNRFSFTSTVTLALLADDYRIVYHPINYYQRIGESKIIPRHFLDFAILIVRMSMMFQPLKVFIPLALAFGFLGVLKVIYDFIALFLRAGDLSWTLLLQPTLSTSALLLLFVGLQFLMIGMVADGMVRRISQHNRPAVPSQAILSETVLWSTREGQSGEVSAGARQGRE